MVADHLPAGRPERERGLSAGEKRMLAKARQILVSELALAEKTNEDKAETILDEAEKRAREIEVEIETELLQARDAGPAIVEEITHWKADLVVVGMPFRMRFGEFHMGRTAPYVLRHAPCRTMLFREAHQL